MKLITTPASPFGRKVRVAAEELGLHDRIEVVVDNPWNANSSVPSLNPVGKVPVLVTDEGTALFDSSVIVEYLDSASGAPRLFPASGPLRWQTLTRASLANQMLDAFITVRHEKRRPAQEQSPGWIQRQEKVVRRCLDALEQQVQDFGRDVTIVSITTAVALGHFDFRVDTMDLAWRESNPNLRRWYETFAARGSMLNTLPHD